MVNRFLFTSGADTYALFSRLSVGYVTSECVGRGIGWRFVDRWRVTSQV